MDRDPELDSLLSALQSEMPDDLALRRWQASLQRPRPAAWWRGPRAIAAALLLMFAAGFGAGALAFHRAPSPAQVAATDTAAPAATEEHLYAKAD